MDIGALGSVDCSRFTVMIVDDIAINTKLLAKLLEPASFKAVLQYNNSQQALDSILSGERPDIVLLDVMMPGVDGFSFRAAVRERYSTEEVSVIMVSAVSESEEVMRATNMGANDYLTKPINAKRLYASIAAQISKLQ